MLRAAVRELKGRLDGSIQPLLDYGYYNGVYGVFPAEGEWDFCCKDTVVGSGSTWLHVRSVTHVACLYGFTPRHLAAALHREGEYWTALYRDGIEGRRKPSVAVARGRRGA